MKTVTDFPQEMKSKVALVRCNFDVPIANSKVTDTTRIEDAIPTIKYLHANDCSTILIAHQDRPQGKYNSDNSLKPIKSILEKMLEYPVDFVPHTTLTDIKLPNSKCILLDNLRFHSEEESNDAMFSSTLSSFADIYVNESFATSHRDHASITGIPKYIPGYLGISFAHEIEVLDHILDKPERPLVIVLGGAKIATKEPLIDAFKDSADSILVGGKLAVDLKSSTKLKNNIKIAKLTSSNKDITEASAKEFASIIKNAGTVIFNGTMGVVEEPPNDIGTRIVAQAVNHTSAYTLIGGGDTEAALTLFDQEANISHISSGGGAMLYYLTNRTLIGIEALS